MGRPADAFHLSQPIRRVEASDTAWDPAAWPFTIPAVRDILTDGLTLGRATVLVGENGSGKSTIVEAIAAAFGLNPEGGTRGHLHQTVATESPLAEHLRLVRGAGAAKDGFFLRAETMHGFFTYLAEAGGQFLHHRSHGESFLDLVDSRFFVEGRPRPGLYLLDEPESALSFSSSLAVLGMLRTLSEDASVQIIMATHSPVLASLPGAAILQLDADGLAPAKWDDLDLVINERQFLADPGRFFRYLDA